MITRTTGIIITMSLLLTGILGCSGPQKISVWERQCESCHDGKTMLNGKVVPDREQLKAKYKTLDDFTKACFGAPSCMNIVKHEENLLTAAGKEIGLPATVQNNRK